MDRLIIADAVRVTLHPMSDDEFFEFCQYNDDLRIERTAEGEIIVMPLVDLATPAFGTQA